MRVRVPPRAYLLLKFMLYTGNGDYGTTGLWGDGNRYEKDSPMFHALGSLDELNSFLGICKHKTSHRSIIKNLEKIQHHLFIIQAELAGSNKQILDTHIISMEVLIESIDDILPPITTFLLPGGTEISAYLDYGRTLARRAERDVIAVTRLKEISQESKTYLNRLSTLLYALARYMNYVHQATETPPNYK